MRVCLPDLMVEAQLGILSWNLCRRLLRFTNRRRASRIGQSLKLPGYHWGREQWLVRPPSRNFVHFVQITIVPILTDTVILTADQAARPIFKLVLSGQ